MCAHERQEVMQRFLRMNRPRSSECPLLYDTPVPTLALAWDVCLHHPANVVRDRDSQLHLDHYLDTRLPVDKLQVDKCGDEPQGRRHVFPQMGQFVTVCCAKDLQIDCLGRKIYLQQRSVVQRISTKPLKLLPTKLTEECDRSLSIGTRELLDVDLESWLIGMYCDSMWVLPPRSLCRIPH
jgi:hypothetical protein